MEVLKIVLTILFIIVCVAITAIILMQEGKQQGLGTIGGQSMDSYWSKNKGRSREGILVKASTALVIVFFVLAAVLNLSVF
ncbi:MAG: preprotein translocase subunit SecG [Lachnospiraceae bacterium]|nr:preprotein translocase subunit SecG [Lachnospiraceae bacterium]